LMQLHQGEFSTINVIKLRNVVIPKLRQQLWESKYSYVDCHSRCALPFAMTLT